MRELLARVKALLRRMQMIQQAESNKQESRQILQFDDLTINEIRHEALINDQTINLSPKEFELLLYFAKNKGKMLSRETILEKIWGWEYIGDSRTVDVHVRWLREKIEANPRNPRRLITVRGSGYIFEG